MSDDLLERLGRENPVPERMPALPFESILARIDDPATAAHAHTEPVERTDRARDGELSKRPAWRPIRLRVLAPLAGVAATVGVVAVVIIASGAHHATPRTRPTSPGVSPSAQVPSPISLLPAHGGMRGLLLGASVAGSGSTLRVSFVQCTNCGTTTPPDARELNWAATSTDGGRRWQTRRERTGLLTSGLALPENRDVWQLGYAPHAGDPGFYVSHNSGRTYRPVRAPSHAGFEPVTLGDGEAWTLGVRCPQYQCRSTVLHGPAGGDTLSQTPTQPPGMPTHRAPIALVVGGYGDRAYVSEGAQRRLYVTNDDGQHWTQTPYPCPARTVIRDLTPTGDGAVWVACQAPLETRQGTSSRTEQNSPVTVHRSEDAGRHWQTPDPALHGTEALVAVSAQVAWAENLTGALQRTTNGGRSWHTVLTGAGRGPSLDIESSTTATVVASATTGTRAAHTRRTELVAYRTTDGGSHWTHTLIHLPPE
jgi:photosystem II stability/assembly factor-like uncharacterized protein